MEKLDLLRKRNKRKGGKVTILFPKTSREFGYLFTLVTPVMCLLLQGYCGCCWG
jgi:hypothetical protein